MFVPIDQQLKEKSGLTLGIVIPWLWIPPDLERMIATGQAIRVGSVVRDSSTGQIIKQLGEIDLSETTSVLIKSALHNAAKNPGVSVGIALGAVALGATVYRGVYYLQDRNRHEAAATPAETSAEGFEATPEEHSSQPAEKVWPVADSGADIIDLRDHQIRAVPTQHFQAVQNRSNSPGSVAEEA